MIAVSIFLIYLLPACAQHVPALHPHITPELKEMAQHAADSIIAEAYWVGHLAAEEAKHLVENVNRDHKLEELSSALKRSSGIVMEKIQKAEAKLIHAIENIGDEASIEASHVTEAEKEASRYLLGVLKSMTSTFSDVGRRVAEVEHNMIGSVRDFSTMEVHLINDSIHSVLEGLRLKTDELAAKGAALKRDQLRLTHPVKEFELEEIIHTEL